MSDFNKLDGAQPAALDDMQKGNMATKVDAVENAARRLDPAGRAATLEKVARVRGALAGRDFGAARKLLVELQTEVDRQVAADATLRLIQAARARG